MYNKYYLTYTTVLIIVACGVTSKLAAIGSAKRYWGNVKHLKFNKYEYFSAESVKMQAFIYTDEKCEEARINRCRK